MDIFLINSPLFRDSNPLYDEDSLPPLGLGYIATNLKLHGYNVNLLDAVADKTSLNELFGLLNEAKPKFIGTNIFTTNCDLVREMVETIKFETHFVIGGLSTKELHKEIFSWKSDNPIDVVTGDGELIMIDIVKNDLQEKPTIQKFNRRWFVIKSGSYYEVKDISNLQLDRSFFTNEPMNHPFGFNEANIVTSRGCIYNCTFCAAARSLNKDYSVRERTKKSISNELLGIKKKFPGVSSIRVLDDLFLKSHGSIIKSIKIFSKLNLQWRSMAHVLSFSKASEIDMINLKKSGCSELFIGIESGSPKILKTINKTRNTELIVSNLTKILKAGIDIKGYFIYGFPGETEGDMLLTYKLAQRLKRISEKHGSNFRTSVFQYRPYHGTQIFHDLEVIGSNTVVDPIVPNKELCDLVGRLQFNFHNGNYSEVDVNILNDYIYKTINLNDGNIFAGLEEKIEPTKVQTM